MLTILDFSLDLEAENTAHVFELKSCAATSFRVYILGQNDAHSCIISDVETSVELRLSGWQASGDRAGQHFHVNVVATRQLTLSTIHMY
jgi:hypothetical protein